MDQRVFTTAAKESRSPRKRGFAWRESSEQSVVVAACSSKAEVLFENLEGVTKGSGVFNILQITTDSQVFVTPREVKVFSNEG